MGKLSNALTHVISLVSLYTPLPPKKNSRFLMFPWDTERDRWHETISLLSNMIIIHIRERYVQNYKRKHYINHCTKKWGFPIRISSVYVTKFAVSCRFGQKSLMENFISCTPNVTKEMLNMFKANIKETKTSSFVLNLVSLLFTLNTVNTTFKAIL